MDTIHRAMDDVVSIGRAAELLGVTPHHLRVLEWEGRIPPARRGFTAASTYGRLYTGADIEFLKSMGIGKNPQRLKSAEEVLELRS